MSAVSFQTGAPPWPRDTGVMLAHPAACACHGLELEHVWVPTAPRRWCLCFQGRRMGRKPEQLGPDPMASLAMPLGPPSSPTRSIGHQPALVWTKTTLAILASKMPQEFSQHVGHCRGEMGRATKKSLSRRALLNPRKVQHCRRGDSLYQGLSASQLVLLIDDMDSHIA